MKFMDYSIEKIKESMHVAQALFAINYKQGTIGSEERGLIISAILNYLLNEAATYDDEE